MSLDRAKKKLKILGVFAHPHDCIHCLGTCGHHVRDGDSVTIAILTDGGSTHNEKLWREWNKSPEKRDEDVLKETREQYISEKKREVETACGYFGVTDVRILGYPDKPIRRTDEMVDRVADLIYETRPDILITEPPARLNPDKFFGEPEDHSTCAAVVTEAYTMVRHPKPGETRGYHLVARKYYCAPSMSFDDVTFHVDISDQYEKRIKAEMAFASQGHTPEYAKIRFERTYGHHGWYAQVNFAEKFLTDDLIVVDRLPVTDHDLMLAKDTVYEQHERLGWTGEAKEGE